jgi:hypothetical protein
MWGDRSSRVKLTGDFSNAIEGIRISNRLPLLVFAKKSRLTTKVHFAYLATPVRCRLPY